MDYSLYFTPMVNAVSGLAEDDADLLRRLMTQWQRKRARNALRRQYRDMRVNVAFLGASVPPYMRDQLDIVCGWPDKAVTSLASRCMWDGVTSPSGEDDPLGAMSLLHENRFDLLVPELVDATLTYCCSFVVALPGDPTMGDPDVVVTGADALWATGLWDVRRRGLEAGLLVDSADDNGKPTSMLLLTAEHVTRMALGDRGWVAIARMDHDLGRVPMESLPYRPSLGRPFGRSRISREVMSITDRVVRAGFRTEVSSDLYAAPAMLLLGADKTMFQNEKGEQTPLWSWYMGRLKSLPKDEDGEKPSLQVIPQQSMEPFLAMKRALAAEFSAATSLPISALGIVQDNPSSAEAIYAAKEDLVIEAQNTTRSIGYGLNRRWTTRCATSPPAGATQPCRQWSPSPMPWSSRSARSPISLRLTWPWRNWATRPSRSCGSGRRSSGPSRARSWTGCWRRRRPRPSRRPRRRRRSPLRPRLG